MDHRACRCAKGATVLPDIVSFGQRIIQNVERVIVGKRDPIRLALVSLLCEGHILLEDVPGVAKTMLARSLATSLGCSFARIQCTPDLLPSDITGAYVFNQKTSEFDFRPGPVLHQVVLADEINRATPRSQSALLECMGEAQLTVDGQTFALPRPFMVIATQNPIEHEGTFPLPEAQLDRFLVRLSVGYPTFVDENMMLERIRGRHPIESLQQVSEAAELQACQQAVHEVFVHEAVREYVVRLVQSTRRCPDLAIGGSPRASLALYRTSQALAALEGRNYALPDDAKGLALAVLPHRVILNPESRLRGKNTFQVIDDLIQTVPAPVGRQM